MCIQNSRPICAPWIHIILLHQVYSNYFCNQPGEIQSHKFLKNSCNTWSGGDTTRDQSFDASTKPYKTQLFSPIKQQSVGEERQVNRLFFYRHIQKWCFPEMCSTPPKLNHQKFANLVSPLVSNLDNLQCFTNLQVPQL